jgi:hypothetical protein
VATGLGEISSETFMSAIEGLCTREKISAPFCKLVHSLNTAYLTFKNVFQASKLFNSCKGVLNLQGEEITLSFIAGTKPEPISYKLSRSEWYCPMV